MAGIEATEASSAKQLLSSSLAPEASSSSNKAEPVKQNDKIEQNFSKKRVGEGEVSLDKEKLEQALREEKKRKAKAGYEDEERYSKKSKSGTVESSTHEVTEEQLGASTLGPRPGVFTLTSLCRGLPNEQTDGRRSYGELCRQRRLLSFLLTLSCPVRYIGLMCM